MANGFPANDDGSIQVPVGFDLNLFGTVYNQIYLNNNGNVTFDSPMSIFTPFDLTTTSRVIIAPFFADVDTRGGGPSNIVRFGNDVVNVDGVDYDAFGIDWVDVGYYNSKTDKLNSFQLIFFDRSDVNPGDFDFEFNYDQILWETGDASGGSGGLGGSSARVGYSNTNADFGESFELPGSAVNGAFLDGNATTGLIHNSISSVQAGRYRFRVRNGNVLPTIGVLELSYFPPCPGGGDCVDTTVTLPIPGLGDFPTIDEVRNYRDAETVRILDAIEQGSGYHGGPPYLDYDIIEQIEFFELIPASPTFIPRPDYLGILEDLDICDYVDNRGVREVWMWGYHNDALGIVPDESNMSMGTRSSEWWNAGNLYNVQPGATFGDVSNAFPRVDDLPICENTYTLYNFTYLVGAGNSIHDHLHQIENLMQFLNTALFWHDWGGRQFLEEPGEWGCGNAHSAPNSPAGGVFNSMDVASTYCPNWEPGRGGARVDVDCTDWGCDDIGFYTWWMQNLPGLDNGLTHYGRPLRNWWGAKFDFDAFLEGGKSLVEIEVLASGASAEIQPATIDFGSVPVDGTSFLQPIYVYNVGDVDIELGSGTLTGADFATTFAIPGFSRDYDTCSGQLLKVKSVCTVMVRFAPTAGVERAGTFEITAPGLPVLRVDLIGRGLEPFSDNFDDGDDTTPLWGREVGTWSVVGGEYRQTERVTGSADAHSSTGDTSWTDYSVEADVRYGDARALVGIAARYTDADNTYLFGMTRQGRGLRVVRIAGGRETVLEWRSFRPVVGQTYHLELEVVGSTLRASLDGVLEWELTDTFHSSGKIALWASKHTDVGFDNVTVTFR